MAAGPYFIKALSLLTPSGLCGSFVRFTFYAVGSFGPCKALLRFLPPNKHTHSNSLSKYAFFYISLSFFVLFITITTKLLRVICFSSFWNQLHSFDGFPHFQSFFYILIIFSLFLYIAMHFHCFRIICIVLTCFCCHYFLRIFQ